MPLIFRNYRIAKHSGAQNQLLSVNQGPEFEFIVKCVVDNSGILPDPTFKFQLPRNYEGTIMIYQITFEAKDEHIDFQNVMDGLYYPFYMEECRHKFVKEILDFDLKENADEGINMVLSQYKIKFLRPILRGDSFLVTCSVHPDKIKKTQMHFKQEIIRSGKITTQGIFSATCISSSGGRPFIPEDIILKIQNEEPLEV